VKVSEPHGDGPALVEDTPSSARAGSDTALYLAAGAARAFWLRAGRGQVAGHVPDLLRAASGLPGLVVEGNRAAEAFGGRLVVVARAGRGAAKPGLPPLLARACLRILNGPGGSAGPPPGWTAADLLDPTDPAREALLYGLTSTLT
jgi:hypothetical protein